MLLYMVFLKFGFQLSMAIVVTVSSCAEFLVIVPDNKELSFLQSVMNEYFISVSGMWKSYHYICLSTLLTFVIILIYYIYIHQISI